MNKETSFKNQPMSWIPAEEIIPHGKPRLRSAYIVNAWYDNIFFIFCPLIAMTLGGLLSMTPLAVEKLTHYGKSETYIAFLGGAFTMAHLVIVFFRSHGNPEIFKLYPKRFVWAPILLFTAMILSSWILIFVLVLGVWWDTYHSSLQTFGLGRIYDEKAGSLSEESRWLDRHLNLVLYLGPILGGATLMDHVLHFDQFQKVGTTFFSAIPVFAGRYHAWMTAIVIVVAVSYFIFYWVRYRRLIRAGLPVSSQKVCLLISTGLCSIYAWGFNSFGQAFFIVNFFHALQYFALVWHVEKKNIRSLPMLLILGLGYGIFIQLVGESSRIALSVLLTVSIMHFWYDGFIWSVRKKQL